MSLWIINRVFSSYSLFIQRKITGSWKFGLFFFFFFGVDVCVFVPGFGSLSSYSWQLCYVIPELQHTQMQPVCSICLTASSSGCSDSYCAHQRACYAGSWHTGIDFNTLFMILSVFIMVFYYKQNHFLKLLKDLASNKAEPRIPAWRVCATAFIDSIKRQSLLTDRQTSKLHLLRLYQKHPALMQL